MQRAVEIGVLCSNASLDEDDKGQGDPTEVALLWARKKFGNADQVVGCRAPRKYTRHSRMPAGSS